MYLMITYQSIYKYDYVDKSTNIWMNENNEQSCLVALVKAQSLEVSKIKKNKKNFEKLTKIFQSFSYFFCIFETSSDCG